MARDSDPYLVPTQEGIPPFYRPASLGPGEDDIEGVTFIKFHPRFCRIQSRPTPGASVGTHHATVTVGVSLHLRMVRDVQSFNVYAHCTAQCSPYSSPAVL